MYSSATTSTCRPALARGARGDRPDAGDRLAARSAERRVARASRTKPRTLLALVNVMMSAARDVVCELGAATAYDVLYAATTSTGRPCSASVAGSTSRASCARNSSTRSPSSGALEEAGGDRLRSRRPSGMKSTRMPCVASASAVFGPIAATCVSPSARASRRARAIRCEERVDAVAAGEHDPRVLAHAGDRGVGGGRIVGRPDRDRRREDRLRAVLPQLRGELVRLRGRARDQHASCRTAARGRTSGSSRAACTTSPTTTTAGAANCARSTSATIVSSVATSVSGVGFVPSRTTATGVSPRRPYLRSSRDDARRDCPSPSARSASGAGRRAAANRASWCPWSDLRARSRS